MTTPSPTPDLDERRRMEAARARHEQGDPRAATFVRDDNVLYGFVTWRTEDAAGAVTDSGVYNPRAATHEESEERFRTAMQIRSVSGESETAWRRAMDRKPTGETVTFRGTLHLD